MLSYNFTEKFPEMQVFFREQLKKRQSFMMKLVEIELLTQ